jgi:hypothetical protein
MRCMVAEGSQQERIPLIFYRSELGTEPVREKT